MKSKQLPILENWIRYNHVCVGYVFGGPYADGTPVKTSFVGQWLPDRIKCINGEYRLGTPGKLNPTLGLPDPPSKIYFASLKGLSGE